MENKLKLIGERIRGIRKSRNLSQVELAFQAGLHYTYIGKVERGEKGVSLGSLISITESLEVSLEDFLVQLILV